MWVQKTIQLRPQQRGFHLITREVVAALPELAEYRVGMAHFFLMHTSASLSLNENASPDVRADFEAHFNQMVPEGKAYYRHTEEGPDDMPAHLKAALLGSSVTLPIRAGSLYLGTWQGLYLCEHRNRGGSRRLVATLWGEAATG